MIVLKARSKNVVKYKRNKKGEAKLLQNGVHGTVEYIPSGKLTFEAYIPQGDSYVKSKVFLEYELYGDPSTILTEDKKLTDEDLKEMIEPYLKFTLYSLPNHLKKKGIESSSEELIEYLETRLSEYTQQKNIAIKNIFFVPVEEVPSPKELEEILHDMKSGLQVKLEEVSQEVSRLKGEITKLKLAEDYQTLETTLEEYKKKLREKEKIIDRVLSSLRESKTKVHKDKPNNPNYQVLVTLERLQSEDELVEKKAETYAEVILLSDELAGVKTSAYEIAKSYCEELLRQGIEPNKELIFNHITKLIAKARRSIA